MTTGDIINIVVTVAIVQLVCDLLANRYVFQQEPYQRLLGRLSRDQSKLKRLEAQEQEAGGQLTEKQKKKLAQAKMDVGELVSEITKRHMFPGVYTAICFFLLYRIFGTEYQGKVVAILPFAPYAFIRRFTMRGIQIDTELFEPMDGVRDPNQACSILFIYMLSTISIKYYVNKAFGTRPPKGADIGAAGILEAPQNQKLLKYWGFDNETLGKVD